MNITTIEFSLESITPLSWSRYLEDARKPGESHDDCDERTWRDKIWATKDGDVYIPGICIHKAIVAAAGKAALGAPGKGQRKIKGYLESGIMVPDDMLLGVKVDEMQSVRLHVPSDGKKGGGTRVPRRFPLIDAWTGEGTILVLDDYLVAHTPLIKEAFEYAGVINGLGRWRPQREGQFGRFKVTRFEVSKAKK